MDSSRAARVVIMHTAPTEQRCQACAAHRQHACCLQDLAGEPSHGSHAPPGQWAASPPSHIAAHQLPHHAPPLAEPLQAPVQQQRPHIPPAEEWIDPSLLNVEEGEDYEGGPSSGNLLVACSIASISTLWAVDTPDIHGLQCMLLGSPAWIDHFRSAAHEHISRPAC